MPTQASSFVCVLGRICAHSRGTVPAPGARSGLYAWQPPAWHRHHQPSPQRASHHVRQLRSPAALPPLGPPHCGVMHGQPQRALERRGCSWEGLGSVPEGSCSPRRTSKAAAPHCSRSAGTELHTQTWLSRGSQPRGQLSAVGIGWLAPLGEQSSRPLFPGALGMGQWLLLSGDPLDPALQKHRTAHHSAHEAETGGW